jgi:hypothetical protein
MVSQKGDEAASVVLEDAARCQNVSRSYLTSSGGVLTVVVFRTIVLAATLNGALRMADVANIVSLDPYTLWEASGSCHARRRGD